MEKVKTFLADISDLLNEKNYQKIYEKNWILFDDAEEALKTLKSKYKLVILSNGDGKQQRKNNQIPTKIIKYTKTFVEEFLWQR